MPCELIHDGHTLTAAIPDINGLHVTYRVLDSQTVGQKRAECGGSLDEQQTASLIAERIVSWDATVKGVLQASDAAGVLALPHGIAQLLTNHVFGYTTQCVIHPEGEADPKNSPTGSDS